MAVFRIVLLLAFALGVTLFALQNLSPLTLVILGMKTQPQPLALWVITAIGAGFATSLAVGWLFRVLNYLSVGKLRSRIRELERELEAQKARPKSPGSQSPPASENYSYSNTSSASYSQEDSTSDDDWEDEEDEEKSTSDTSKDRRDVTDRSYEVKQEPTSSYRSGSVYSYSYKNPSNSGVGKTESVYDADYRVITPPVRDISEEQTEKSEKNDLESKKSENDEDWGFDDDEDFDNEDLDNRSRRR